MGTLANSEDPDKMQHNAAFHQVLHFFLRLKQISRTEIHHNLENSTCDPLKCKMDNPIHVLIVWDNPSEYKGLNRWDPDQAQHYVGSDLGHSCWQ